MADLNALLGANAEILAELDQRAAKVDEREDRARAIIRDCAAERREIEAERATIEAANQLYRRKFSLNRIADDADDATPLAAGDPIEVPFKPQQRIRIGDQRYRIMARMRQWNRPVDLHEIVSGTGLSARRVRDQLRADVTDGFMAESDHGFSLTIPGAQLLMKFEQHRRAKNEPLPSLDGPVADDDGNSESAEFSDEGDVLAEHLP